MMIRKVCIILSCFLIIFGLFLIKGQPVKAQDNTLSIDLEGAIDRAMGNNEDIYIIKSQIHSKSLNTTLTGVSLEQNQKAIDDLNHGLDEKEKEITVNITQTYHSILLKQKQIKLQEAIVDRFKIEYDMKKKQIELGKDVDSSLLTYQINLSQGQDTLQSLNADLDGLYLDLNNYMGDDLDQKVMLKDEEMQDEELDINDLNKLSDDLVQNSYDLKSIGEDMSIAAEQKSAAPDSQKASFDDQLATLWQNQVNEKVSEEYKVRTDYNDILNKRDQVTISKLDLDKYNRLKDAAELKYKLGLITDDERKKSQQDAENAFYNYMQARLDCIIATKKYKNFIEPALNN